MNEALLIQRREAELQAQMHEHSKTSHYTKLGSAFVGDNKLSPRPSVKGSFPSR